LQKTSVVALDKSLIAFGGWGCFDNPQGQLGQRIFELYKKYIKMDLGFT
jgi:hypothetical protein